MTREDFDAVIHAPIRLQICAVLDTVAEVEFRALREQLGVSDSVLSKHLKVLEEAGYLDLAKRSADGRQRTWLRFSKDGVKSYKGHIKELKRIIKRF